jgi:hypothetical protein
MSDLHLLAPVTPDEPRPRRGASVLLAVALVLVVAAVIWLLVALVQGTREEARTEAAIGRSAHAAGDCAAAGGHLKAALNQGTVSFLESPVDRSGLRAEIAACEELESARHLAGREEYGRAIKRFGNYLASGSALYAGALGEQAEARVELGLDLEARRKEPGAVRQYATVMAAVPGTTPAERAEKRVWTLYKRDIRGHRKKPCQALDPARAWTHQEGEALEPVRDAAHDTLAWSLLRCGEQRIARAQAAARDARFDPGTFGAARYVLEWAAESYPDTKPGRLAAQRLDALPGVKERARSLAAEVAKERLRISTIKKQVAAALRDGDDLRQPRKTGDGGNTVRLTVRNATGSQLYVAWTGRETDSVMIPAGGKTCAKAATVTISLPPGSYQFATREKTDWSGASWSLPGGAFRTCVK